MAMSYTAARDALITFLNTAWVAAYPAVPVFYENHEPIDVDRVGSSFIRVTVTFETTRQASIEAAPMTQVVGHVFINVMEKEGSGTRLGLTYSDTLITLFKYKNISGVQVGNPAMGHKVTVDGWHFQEIMIPFRFYT